MKPQPGEYWRDRNGDIYGPIIENDDPVYPIASNGWSYMDDGQYNCTMPTHRDLITRVYVTDWPDGAVKGWAVLNPRGRVVAASAAKPSGDGVEAVRCLIIVETQP